MFTEPVKLSVDYPEEYYSDELEEIRVGYKNVAKLLLRDLSIILSNPDVINFHRDCKRLEVNKIVTRHVEDTFNTIEDIIGASKLSYMESLDSGVGCEYEIYNLIYDDVRTRDHLESVGVHYLQANVHVALGNRHVMEAVLGGATITVTQTRDYLEVSFG